MGVILAVRRWKRIVWDGMALFQFLFQTQRYAKGLLRGRQSSLHGISRAM